jgi:hypothetical protein
VTNDASLRPGASPMRPGRTLPHASLRPTPLRGTQAADAPEGHNQEGKCVPADPSAEDLETRRRAALARLARQRSPLLTRPLPGAGKISTEDDQ